MRFSIIPITAALALVACGPVQTPLSGLPMPSLSGGGGRPDLNANILLFSPNGEPLNGGKLGRPKCAEATGQWFDRADGNHDGVLDHEEFLADALAQFRRMDLDGDGFVTADEVTAYRLPYLDAGKTEGQRRGRGEKALSMPTDADDPVMSADANLDFQVSLAEFTAAAEAKFAVLAIDGKITRDRMLATCRPVVEKE